MIYSKYIDTYSMSSYNDWYNITMIYFLNLDSDTGEKTETTVQKYTVHKSKLSISYNNAGFFEMNANGTKLFGLSNEYYWFDGAEITLLQPEYIANSFISQL